MLTTSAVATALGVEPDAVERWATDYAEYLGPASNPGTGRERRFSSADLCVLFVVAEFAEYGEDAEDIHYHLNTGAQHEARLTNLAQLHTPLFQDDFEEEGEDVGKPPGRAGSCRRSGRSTATAPGLKARHQPVCPPRLCTPGRSRNNSALPCPRSGRNTYLKALLKSKPKHHDIGELTETLEREMGRKIAGWVKDRLRDFHEIDRRSTAFRFADSPPPGEVTVDLYHLRVVMNNLTDAFDEQLAKSGLGPRW